jgi:hypothetical protein
MLCSYRDDARARDERTGAPPSRPRTVKPAATEPPPPAPETIAPDVIDTPPHVALVRQYAW